MDIVTIEIINEYENDINECIRSLKKTAKDCKADLSNINTYVDYITWLANRLEKDINSYVFYKSL